MKKIILTSLLAAFVITSAKAVDINKLNGNVLYRPMAQTFYMTGDNWTNTDFELFKMQGEVGYGITDDMSVYMVTTSSYDSSDNPRYGTKFNWDAAAVGMSLRYMNEMHMVGDFYAEGGQNLDSSDGLHTQSWNWTAGTNFGYTGFKDMVLSMNAEANYITDARGSADYDAWGMTLGMEAFYEVMDNFALMGGLEYDFNLSKKYYVNNPMTAKMGVSYDMQDIAYVEVYGFKDVKQGFNTSPMGMGMKFGLEF